MTDTRIIALVAGPVSAFAAVLFGVLINYNRLNDLRDLMRAEMAKNHSELLLKFAEMDHRIDRVDQRLSRLEQQRLVQ